MPAFPWIVVPVRERWPEFVVVCTHPSEGDPAKACGAQSVAFGMSDAMETIRELWKRAHSYEGKESLPTLPA